MAVAHPRGRGRVLPRTLEAIDEEMGAAISKDAGVVIDSPIAAAASTLVYQLAYGDGSASNGNREGEDVNDREDNDVNDRLSDLDYSIPEGLVFLDDEDVLVIEADSNDELFRSLFPKDESRTKNLVLGGPQPPDLSNYPEDERKDVWKAYKKKRKAYNDKEHNKRAKIARDAGLNVSVYSGCNHDQLRTMNNIESAPLLVGHSFSTKDILHLRVAEEAILQGIVMKVGRSNDWNFTASGVDFYVRVSFTERVGWTVHSAVFREGGDLLKIPPKFRVDPSDTGSRRSLTTPLKSKMIVLVIVGVVAENPGIPYQLLREILKPYANDYALMDSILQEGRDLAKVQLFGRGEDNIQYAKGVLQWSYRRWDITSKSYFQTERKFCRLLAQ